MRLIFSIPSSIGLALIVSSATAQTAPAVPAAPAAPAAASMPMDCNQMKRHDHGAERGTPTPAKADCAQLKPASAPNAKTKAKAKAHDHNKVHKTM